MRTEEFLLGFMMFSDRFVILRRVGAGIIARSQFLMKDGLS